jgi:hypothetical protein
MVYQANEKRFLMPLPKILTVIGPGNPGPTKRGSILIGQNLGQMLDVILNEVKDLDVVEKARFFATLRITQM